MSNAAISLMTTANSEAIVARIEGELERAISSIEIVEPLRSAVVHMLFPGGKRIRPMLAVLTVQDMGGDIDLILPAAISLELLHTSTLIHDDLPAMDNDDFRRGKPTCHKAFGEATAILAGDLLLALALNFIDHSRFTDSEKWQLTRELTTTYIKLCNGQELDILPEGERGTLQRIHELKTGALFSTTLKFAAIGARSSIATQELAGELGLALGLYFQIVDDFIDAHGGDGGRPSSSDQRNEKVTFFNRTAEDEAFKALTAARKMLDKKLDSLRVALNSERGLTSEFSGLSSVISQIDCRLEKAGFRNVAS
jgi:geranylgeranyl pyrophosphate synthase